MTSNMQVYTKARVLFNVKAQLAENIAHACHFDVKIYSAACKLYNTQTCADIMCTNLHYHVISFCLYVKGSSSI